MSELKAEQLPELVELDQKFQFALNDYNETTFSLKRKLDEIFGSRPSSTELSPSSNQKEPSCYIEATSFKVDGLLAINEILRSELERLNKMI